MSTFPEFTGTLSFSVTGPGVSIDPATGAISIAADRLQEGIEVAITAAEADGTATGRFRLTFQAIAAPPRLMAAPVVAGPAVIGSPADVDPGSWEDASSLALQWCRDGADIAGATAESYVPVAEDDCTQLTCRVTASNAAGSATAETAAVEVIHVAPSVTGTLGDLELELDSGPRIVEAAAAFAGEALAYAVDGAGATIDPATGKVSIPTGTLLTAAAVSVTASNSGGSATAGFKVTVRGVAPAVTTAPKLEGTGKIGAAVSVDPGIWSGKPAPTLALQWRRGGTDIAGATAASYVPVAADDRTQLTCRVTASNVAGSATAETAAIAVTQVAPSVTGTLGDLDLELDSGPRVVEAAPAFTGAGLSYAVTGAGATIDPATGKVSIPTGTLLTAAAVSVTASNSGGSATAGFKVTVRGVAPAVTTAPKLEGTGKIGAAVSVDPGSWSGKPAPTLALQWRRGGTDIAGATAASYVPVVADDRTQLSCRVTASNVAGSVAATTPALAVTRVAPVASGTLADVTLVQGAAAGSVEAAPAFTGAGLSYAVTGAGATIDPATGKVSIPTGTLVTAAAVTVTASNSGGSATAGFKVTVKAAATVTAPAAVGRIADVSFPLDNATHSVSTQSAFSGSDLVYALETAPAGTTIHAGSGLVEFAATAPLSAAPVTVRASNAAGSATQSFKVTIRTLTTVFDAAAKLADVSFIYEGAAPSWTLKGGVLARLVPAATGRVHGNWIGGGDDGLYRALVRWNSSNTGTSGASPFLFGARIGRSGSNFTGFYVEAARISGNVRQLRLLQYTGSGTATTLVAATTSDWVWYTWYWFEMEVAGTAVKARLYAPDAQAPAWQLQGSITQTAAGLFGPSAFPIGGVGPSLDIQRLEFVPGTAATAPAAAADGDWELNQSTEQK